MKANKEAQNTINTLCQFTDEKKSDDSYSFNYKHMWEIKYVEDNEFVSFYDADAGYYVASALGGSDIENDGTFTYDFSDNDFRIYLTKNFLVSVYGGKLTALDLAKVRLTRLFETVKGSMNVITLEVTTTEQEKITVSENEWSFFTMNEEEITYLTDVFGKRNIEFVCEIQPDEEIDEDEEF